LDTPQGARCISCALVFAGVRRRRRTRRVVERPPAPLATLSWQESATLVDLRPVLAARREAADLYDERVEVRAA
jgi:hypothetical protein